MDTTARQVLDLEWIGPTRFRSVHSQRNHTGALYGGQVLGQALAAAARTVVGWPVHSMHGYFLRSGSAFETVDYDVAILRDGRRFAARQIMASQAGRLIFHMHCSFHDPETGFDHQVAMPPDIPAPEKLLSLSDFVRAHADRLPPLAVENYSAPFPLELRLIEPERFFSGPHEEPNRRFWVRMPSAREISDPVLQQCLLAFASDYWLAGASATRHMVATDRSALFLASIDHAMWFHRPARVNEWLLYQSDSPSAGLGRGLARGLLFDQAGTLIASTAQEAVLRPL